MVRRWTLLAVCIVWSAPGCGSSASPTLAPELHAGQGGGVCVDGQRDCACYRNQTCNDGLRCADGVCRAEGAAAEGGASGSSGRQGSSGEAEEQAQTGGSDAGTAGRDAEIASAGREPTGGAAGDPGGAGGSSMDASGGLESSGGRSGAAGEPTSMAGAGAELPVGGAGAAATGTGGSMAGSGGTSGTGGAAGNGQGCSGGLEQIADGLCVAKLVSIPSEDGQFQIDATEVSAGQYSSWLDTEPSTTPVLLSACSYNDSFEPDPTCLETVPAHQSADHHPVVCVDWCDAFFYCDAVGKRLCGSTHGGSGAFDRGLDDWYTDQWTLACSLGGDSIYGYDGEQSASACNGQDAGIGTTVPVASLATCQHSDPAYAGVYDLSGNVEEWVDACDKASSNNQCNVRGGSYQSAIHCEYTPPHYYRMSVAASTGFRCCSR